MSLSEKKFTKCFQIYGPLSKLLHFSEFVLVSLVMATGSHENHSSSIKTGLFWCLEMTKGLMAWSPKIVSKLLWSSAILKLILTSFQPSTKQWIVFYVAVTAITSGYCIRWLWVLFVHPLVQCQTIVIISIMPYWFASVVWFILFNRIRQSLHGLGVYIFDSCCCLYMQGQSGAATAKNKTVNKSWLLWSSSCDRWAKRSISVFSLRNTSESYENYIANIWNFNAFSWWVRRARFVLKWYRVETHVISIFTSFTVLPLVSSNIGKLESLVLRKFWSGLRGLSAVLPTNLLWLWIGRCVTSILCPRRHWSVGVKDSSPVWFLVLVWVYGQAPFY